MLLSRSGVLSVFLLILSFLSVAEAKDVTIAILSDAKFERASIDSDHLKREISALLGREFTVKFDERYRYGANSEFEKIKELSDKALADKDIDLIIAMGVVNANYLAHRPLNKPVVAPYIIDPELQGLKMVDGRSGIKNFTYITDDARPSQFIGAFQKITPFSNVAVLADDSVVRSIGDWESILSQFELLGLKMSMVKAGNSGLSALKAIDQGNYDAVMLAPLPRFGLNEIKVIADGLIERKLPGFGFNGRAEVEQGLLAGFATEENTQRLTRRIALDVQRILLGEKPEDIPVVMKFNSRVILNQATAYALNRFPDFNIIDQFVVINQGQFEKSRELNLKQAMQIAQQRSLNVAVTAYQTEASRANLKSFKARLLPDIDASANYRRIKEASATAFNPEEQTSAQLTLSQPLYSDEAFGFYATQKYQHLSQEKVLEQQRLDAALDAAVGYLNLLKAREVERLQKENLERASRNLDLAKVRRDVGSASAGEVYRWESEIATNRSNYAAALSQSNQLNVSLLSLLNYPQDENLVLEDVSVEGTDFFFNDERFDSYVANPWSFRHFHSFMVSEAMLGAPELQQLSEQVKGQERALTTAKRKHWAPLVVANASLTDVLDTSGVGSNAAQETDTWQMGVNASLPLFSGGADSAAVSNARETLLAVRMQERASRNAIEQRVRAQLIATEASYPTMQYSANAAEASRKNLDLVTDAYKRGTVSIIDLIDAQNAALSAEINAVNSVYDFMIDYFNLERIVGRFDILSNNRDKESWYQRIESFFNDNKQ